MKASRESRLDLLRQRLERGEHGQEDPLGSFLGPVVLEQITHETGELERLRATWSRTVDASQLDPGADRMLHQAGERVERLGWVLASLASASGMDLVQERREERGLLHLVELLELALRDEGIALGQPALEPLLRPAARDGWRLPWAVGTLLLGACLAEPRPERISWSVVHASPEARIELPGGAWVGRLANSHVTRLLPEARLESGIQGWRLMIPGSWLRNPGKDSQAAASRPKEEHGTA